MSTDSDPTTRPYKSSLPSSTEVSQTSTTRPYKSSLPSSTEVSQPPYPYQPVYHTAASMAARNAKSPSRPSISPPSISPPSISPDTQVGDKIDWMDVDLKRYPNFQSDWDKITSQQEADTVDSFKKWAGVMVRTILNEDEQGGNSKILKDLLGRTMYHYGEDLIPHIRNEASQDWIDENINIQSGTESPSKFGDALSATSDFAQGPKGAFNFLMDTIDRGDQGFRSSLLKGGEGDIVGAARELSKGIGNVTTGGAFDTYSVDKDIIEKYDKDGDERISFEELIGTDINYGSWYGSGVLEDATRFTGEVTTSPFTWMGGASTIRNLKKGAVATAGRHADKTVKPAVVAALRRAEEKGTKVWTASERNIVAEVFAIQALDKGTRVASKLAPTARRAKPSPAYTAQVALNDKAAGLIQVLQNSRLAAKPATVSTPRSRFGSLPGTSPGVGIKGVDKPMRKLDRMGRSGFRFAGRNIPGTSRITRPGILRKRGAWEQALAPATNYASSAYAPRHLPYVPRFAAEAGEDYVPRFAAEESASAVVPGLYTLTPNSRTALGNMINNNPLIQQFGNAFIPRFGVGRSLGASTGDEVRIGVIRSERRAKASAEDVNTRLSGSLARDAAKEAENAGRDLDAILVSALGSHAGYMAAKTSRVSHPGTAIGRLVETLDTIRMETYKTFSPEAQEVLDPRAYNPRVWSEKTQREVAKRARKDPDFAQELSDVLGFHIDDYDEYVKNSGVDDYLKERSILKTEQDVFVVNKHVDSLLRAKGIEGIDELYETNMLAAWSARSESAFNARIKVDFGDALAKVTDDFGNPVFRWLDDGVSADVSKILTKKTEVFGRPAIFHKDLTREVDNFFEVLDNPKAFQKILKEVQETWAANALLSTSYHARNEQTNIMLMALGGMKRIPHWVNESAKYSRINRRILKEQGESGATYQAAANKLNIPKHDVEILEQSIELGIWSGGQTDQVLESAGNNRFMRRVLRPDKLAATGSRKVGSALEGNSRMAMFLHRIDAGDDFAQSAHRTNEVLFDYTDLTPFEKVIKSTTHRFYTFPRKNTALQLRMLGEQPGRVAAIEKIKNEVVDGITTVVMGTDGDDHSGGEKPWWTQAAGMGWRGGDLIGAESGLTAASETFESLAIAAGSLAAIGTIPFQVAGVEGSLPDPIRDAIFYGERSDQFARAFALTSGFYPSMTQWAFGLSSGTDLFTGQPHEDSRTNELFRFLATANPFIARGQRLFEDLGLSDKITPFFQNEEKMAKIHKDAEGAIETAERNGESTLNMQTGDEAVEEFMARGNEGIRSVILNWGLGLSFVPGEKARRQQEYTLKTAWGEVLDSLGGTDTLTVRQWAEEGVKIKDDDLISNMMYLDRTQAGVDGYYAEVFGAEAAAILFDLLPEDRDTAVDDEAQREDTKNKLLGYKDMVKIYYGRDLTNEELVTVAGLSYLALSKAKLSELGLRDPSSPSNRYIEEDTAVESTPEENLENLEFIVSVFGKEVEDLWLPRVDDLRLSMIEGKRVGMTDNEAIGAWLRAGGWNDKTLQAVFGEDAVLSEVDQSRTERDEQMEQTRAADLKAQINTIIYAYSSKLPTVDQVNAIIFQLETSIKDQEAQVAEGVAPGPRRPSFPGPSNTQTEDEERTDRASERDSQIAGQVDGPYVGRFAATPERRSLGPGIPAKFNRTPSD